MKLLSQELNFRMVPDGRLCLLFPKIGSLLGKCTLFGQLRGKQVKIFTTRFPGIVNFPVRLVIKAPLCSLFSGEQPSIVIKTKPLFYNIHKIFDKNLVNAGEAILDNRLVFFATDTNLLKRIIQYDEICYQMCEVWKNKKIQGILVINKDAVLYHEPFKLITGATRQRIKDAAHLICDIIDVLKMRHKI